MMRFSYISAFFWGILWAVFLQRTKFGRWLAIKRTWITVVVGIGIDLLLALPLLPSKYWWRLLTVIWLSSIGIVSRSLLNEISDDQKVIQAILGR